jgi:hypothetical protein
MRGGDLPGQRLVVESGAAFDPCPNALQDFAQADYEGAEDMTRSRTRVALAGFLVLVVMGLSAGCTGKTPAEMISVWPQANAEKTVPAPPIPPAWPLTGLEAPTKASGSKRPLSIKIENSPAARPQTGLNSADVAYETVTEGGITRFNLIFQSNIPKIVGPVRSARLSDLWVVPQYRALFFYSGASSSVTSRVKQAGLPDLSQDAGISYPYSRSSARPAPHNLYIDTKKAYVEAKRRGKKVTAKVPSLEFGPASIATSASPVKSVYIPFSSFNNVTWTWSKKRHVFLRQNNGKIHRDAETGKQVAAKNVVVMWAKYTAASHDKVGSTTYNIKLGGKGKATVFRDGKRYNGKWIATRTQPPHFVDKNGRPIRLAPGNTWMQVVPLDVNISMK